MTALRVSVNKAESDLFGNERFQMFRSMLEEKGYHLRLLWSANSGSCNPDTGKRFRYDNVGLFAVVTDGTVPPPKTGTVLIQNYGHTHGYGIWFDGGSNDFEADLKLITG